VHVRVGGFQGSQLQVEQCRKSPEKENYVNKDCIGAFMSMHITKSAYNLYMENNWLWVAE
jgi:glucan 1,3-beta-glucosidase